MPESFTKDGSKKERLKLIRPNGPFPGDIILFAQATGYSKVIPWFTKSRYYHCALYEGNNCVLEARPSGVVRRDIKREAGNIVRIIPMPNKSGADAVSFAEKCLGANYDPLDILFIVLRQCFPKSRFTYSNHKRFVCSELVVLAWRSAGIDLFPDCSPDTIRPGDFAQFLPPDARDIRL